MPNKSLSNLNHSSEDSEQNVEINDLQINSTILPSIAGKKQNVASVHTLLNKGHREREVTLR